MAPIGYWHSRWPGEDGGPLRRQEPADGGELGLRSAGRSLAVTHRPVSNVGVGTMVVQRAPGELYMLCHTGGEEATSWVEQIDPVSLRTIRRSPSMEGGPTWPGGIACHDNGSIYVVFGQFAHRLSPELDVLATVRLPRRRPYNSFVILPDGCLAAKDFGGLRPGQDEQDDYEGTEVVVLEPEWLEIVARRLVPEPSIARLSAEGSDVYVVGESSLWRVRWSGSELTLDSGYRALYRTLPGQGFGWDAVLENGAAWFHDNGQGTERYAGSLRGLGVSRTPSNLVHVHLMTGEVTLTEICGLQGGVVANPPVIDPVRRVVVAYDSGNGVVTGFRIDPRGVTGRLWSREINHAAHMLRYPSGELVLCDYDHDQRMEQVLVIDIETGQEYARADTGSPVQSVLFPAPGFGRDFYLVSFSTLTRCEVA